MIINQQSPKKSKAVLAKELNISRFSLYYKPKLPAKDLELKAKIEMVMSEHKAYGHKRIADHLNINKKRILRVMKLFNLRPKRRHKLPAKPGDVDQQPMAIPNLLMGLPVSYRCQVWCGDFTYLWHFNRFIYLATVIDVYTREIMGWSVSVRHDTRLITEALQVALRNHSTPEIFHSDQGSEYRSHDFINFLKKKDIKPSMSKKASPWQNGYQESFYSGFKIDLGHPECYQTLGELVANIAKTIHYYNTQRIHTKLKMPPAIFATRYEIKIQNQNIN